MKTRETFVYFSLVVTMLLLSLVDVQAKSLQMPSKPILLEGLKPVIFDHVLHQSLEVPCDECHHINKYSPRKKEDIFTITDSKLLHCSNCHNKDFINPYYQNREDIFHTNCRVCHAVGLNGIRGPRKCDGCHS